MAMLIICRPYVACLRSYDREGNDYCFEQMSMHIAIYVACFATLYTFNCWGSN